MEICHAVSADHEVGFIHVFVGKPDPHLVATVLEGDALMPIPGNAATEDRSTAAHIPLRIAEVCEIVPVGATKSESGPTWIRTKNQGIMSPLL